MPSDPAPTTEFRKGLLDGVGVAVAGGGAADGLGGAVAKRCRSLGARVAEIECRFVDESAAEAAVGQAGAIDTLVIDVAAMFHAGAGDGDGLGAFRAAVDGAWNVARAAATGGMIGSGEGGKIVLIAPAPGAGPHAGAARAALENTARTVSVEWARFQVRTTVIAPADDTAAEDVAALVAYLASPAGDYFSGCRFSLGEVAPG